ncbi:AAA family ATPase [Mycobacterium sp. E3305]|uniref:AAA family ATPase n=1 Tax=Mycobacterium sp. E3305 TaxID=1834145 RepID=UPI0008002A4D|nr:AAA family ATPase [Mycobacterium sp. E3305]OBG70285.1 hypothetical protein A5701_03600 [Mycobacterium sp. E3305]
MSAGNAYRVIVDALEQRGRNPRETGTGKAVARCPAHDDHDPSLSVFPRTDGKGIRVKCHAGCDYRDILAALGLHPRDLYDDEPLRRALKPVTHHRYPNGSYKTRQPKPGGGKTMRWHGRKDNQLYLADQIPDGATTVYLTESEKAADVIRAVGAVAVATGGAESICDLTPLNGLDVYALVDRDNAGLAWAANQRKQLDDLDPFTTVRWVRCPLDIPKADIGEHFDHELTLAELEEFDPFTASYEVDRGPDDDTTAVVDEREPQPPPEDRAVRGGAFLFGPEYTDGPAVWGDGSNVLWSPGEPLMIAAYQGLCKTTLAGQLTRALLHLGDDGRDDKVLGFTVTATPRRVLYLAMDRPRQIRRSLRRQFSEQEAGILDERLVVWPGPPAADLAAQPLLLLGLAERHHADVVIVDSLKDAALKLSSDETGAAWNRAAQHLLMSNRELCVLHHPRKLSHNEKDRRLTIEDIYGSTWITNGCGSVILLDGEPGDPIIEFRHLKQPNEEIGPLRVAHDPATGRLTVEHQLDLVELVRRKGDAGLIAKDAARALFDTDEPSRGQTEKARRKLDKFVPAVLRREEGVAGGATGGMPARYFLAGLWEQP